MGAKLLICITAFLTTTLSSQLILWQPVDPFIATEEGGNVFPTAVCRTMQNKWVELCRRLAGGF